MVNIIVSPTDLTPGETNLVLIQTRLVRDRSARVLGGSRGDQGLGAVEGGAEAGLDLLVGVGLLTLG